MKMEKKICMDGYDTAVVTMKTSGTVAKGDICEISGNYEVKKCTADGTPFGVVLNVRDGLAAVQTRGYVSLKCDSTITTPGYIKIAVADNTVKSGAKISVFIVNVSGGTAGILL